MLCAQFRMLPAGSRDQGLVLEPPVGQPGKNSEVVHKQSQKLRLGL